MKIKNKKEFKEFNCVNNLFALIDQCFIFLNERKNFITDLSERIEKRGTQETEFRLRIGNFNNPNIISQKALPLIDRM